MDDNYHLLWEGIELQEWHKRKLPSTNGNIASVVGSKLANRLLPPRERRAGRNQNASQSLLPGSENSIASDATSWSYKPSASAANMLNMRSSSVDVIPPTGVQTYVPPVPHPSHSAMASVPPLVQGLHDHSSSISGEQYMKLLFYGDGPPRPSVRRALMPQQPMVFDSEYRALTTTSDTKRILNSGSHTAEVKMRGMREKNQQDGPIAVIKGPFSRGAMCMQCVRTQEIGIFENNGKFQEVLEPGVHLMCWPFSDVAGRVSLRIQQLDIVCETKTKDNVFVHLSVAVQFQVIREKVYDAYYRLTDPGAQIQSQVLDVMRSTIPRLDIDDLFVSKSDVALAVFKALSVFMYDYGYEILKTLVVDIAPDAQVKASMNEIFASKRRKEAMPHVAEAEKNKQVKAAQASAEAAHMSGLGVARQRKAIAQGIQSTIADHSTEDKSDPRDVMHLLLVSQYLDTLSAIGADSSILQHGIKIGQNSFRKGPCKTQGALHDKTPRASIASHLPKKLKRVVDPRGAFRKSNN